jgi:hypothetical protein
MKPIINQLVSQLHTEYENGLMKAVQSCGFDVDKERLAQALNDAKKFYTEGYHDAMVNHDVVKVVRCKDCEYYENEECVNPYIWMSDGAHLWPDEDFYCAKGERRSDDDPI